MDSRDCENCVHEWKSPMSEVCVTCGFAMNNFEEKLQTNGDRIRAMSDEGLANFVAFASQDAYCYGAGMRDGMKIYPFESYESALSWMKQPVDESEVKEWEEN